MTPTRENEFQLKLNENPVQLRWLREIEAGRMVDGEASRRRYEIEFEGRKYRVTVEEVE